MPNTDQAELAKFHKLCEVSIIVEEDGSNPVLCVSANVRDTTTGEYHEFKRSVALLPLMRALANKIREYHDKLHLQMSVSGRISDITADFDSYDDWRMDIERRSFLNAPEFLDDGGLPPGADPLQIQGWLDSIKKTARHLGEAKAVKSLYTELKTYGHKAQHYADKGTKWASAHKNEISMASAFIPGVGPGVAAAMQTGFKVYDAVQAAKKNNPEALAALKKIKSLAEDGDPKAIEAFKTAQNMLEMMKAKEAGATQVSGWLYNRPYRTNAQTLMDAAAGKFPTLSLALREGWHDGLSFVGQMQRKNIKLLGV